MTSIYAEALIDIKREMLTVEKLQYISADAKAVAMTELLKKQKYIIDAQERAREQDNALYREIMKIRAATLEYMDIEKNG